jgi:hypothetical protein
LGCLSSPVFCTQKEEVPSRHTYAKFGTVDSGPDILSSSDTTTRAARHNATATQLFKVGCLHGA